MVANIRDGWVDYWTAVAGGGVALLGLAFVAYQTRREAWSGSRLERVNARFTLSELGIPAAAYLIALMAGHPWRAASVLMGIVGVVLLVWFHWALRRDRSADRQRWLSVLTVAVIVSLFAAPFRPEEQGLWLFAVPLLWLLTSGALETWLALRPQPSGELAVDSVEKAACWYRDQLGGTVSWSFGDIAEVKWPDLTLLVRKRANAVDNAEPDMPSRPFVLTSADPHRLVRQAVENGASGLSSVSREQISSGDHRRAVLRDPFGAIWRIEL